ncbi:MAG: hypothetical protein E7254_00695 [Lachnospiraceae bacterium]|nr:hypothetical protein [Lachnospiraceae bacterium]
MKGIMEEKKEELQENNQENIQYNNQENDQEISLEEAFENDEAILEEATEEKNADSSKKKSIFDNNFVRLLVAMFILACCAGLGAGIAVVEDKSDPIAYVAQYFGKFLVKDFEGMYKYVDNSEDVIKKEEFVKLMKELKSETNVGSYEFKKAEKVDDRYRIRVNYIDSVTEEDCRFDIYLYKHGGIFSNLFSKWSVSVRDYVAKDFYVKIPATMKAKFDGEELSDNQICEADSYIKTSTGEIMIINPENSDSMSEFKTYKVENIIMGNHYVYVYSDYMEMDRTVSIFESGKKAGFVAEQAKIKKDYLQTMEKNSGEIVKEFYEAVRNRKTATKKLLIYFENNKKLKKKINKLLLASQDAVFWPDTRNIDDYKLMELNFSDMKHEAEYIGDGKYKFNYSYSYYYLSSTDTSVSTSYIFELEGDVNSTMTLTYKVVDGKLVVSDIAMKNKNKKKK